MHHSYGSDDRRTGTTRATLRSGFHDPLPVLYRFGGLIMTIASLIWSQKATATREVLASNDVRTLIANQLGVDVKRVTDEAHFTDDLGADWLDRLELMIVIEDRFADVVITDEEVDQLEVVGDLIRHIENADHERRRRSNVEATTMRNNTNRPRTWPQSCHWK
jgi:acyl carrier protein